MFDKFEGIFSLKDRMCLQKVLILLIIFIEDSPIPQFPKFPNKYIIINKNLVFPYLIVFFLLFHDYMRNL